MYFVFFVSVTFLYLPFFFLESAMRYPFAFAAFFQETVTDFFFFFDFFTTTFTLVGVFATFLIPLSSDAGVGVAVGVFVGTGLPRESPAGVAVGVTVGVAAVSYTNLSERFDSDWVSGFSGK